MNADKALALVIVLVTLTLGIIIPSIHFINKKLDFKPAKATIQQCCG